MMKSHFFHPHVRVNLQLMVCKVEEEVNRKGRPKTDGKNCKQGFCAFHMLLFVKGNPFSAEDMGMVFVYNKRASGFATPKIIAVR